MGFLEWVGYIGWESGKTIFYRIPRWVGRGVGFLSGAALAGVAVFGGMTGIASFLNFVGLTVMGSAVSGFIGTAAGGLATAASLVSSALPFIAPALSTVGSFASGVLSAVPFLAQGGAYLSTALTAVGLGFSWTPVGWGIAAIAALPAVVGGLYEAGARTWQFIKGSEDSSAGARLLRGLAAVVTAPITFPLNFTYGFVRTAWHMLTGKGYLGCIKETYNNVNRDLRYETVTADHGGRSLLRGLVPNYVDRLVVGPAAGLLRGAAYSTVQVLTGEAFGSGKAFLKVLRAPWQGMWRGFAYGSHAGADVYSYLSQNNNPIPAPDVPVPVDEYTPLNTTKQIASALGMEVGLSASASGHRSKYEFAESVGRKEAYKLASEHTDSKKHQAELEQKIADEVTKENDIRIG